MKPIFICISCNIEKKEVVFLSTDSNKRVALKKASKRTKEKNYQAFNIMQKKKVILNEMIIWLNEQGVTIPDAKIIVKQLFIKLVERIDYEKDL